MAFLPVNKQDMQSRGWDKVDFVYVSGDAYVDHPSFGHAIITRVLERHGFKIGILAQPDWKNINAFKEFGRPRLGFLVSSGNIDSMVNHYTAAKKPRSQDAYSPGGKAGLRPNRANIVYVNCIRQAYKNVPIIIGGVEASLRRFAQYDYWDDKVRASILYDSGADLLLYGMGERSIVQLAQAMDSGIPIDQIHFIDGSSYITDSIDDEHDYIMLDSYESVKSDKLSYAKSFIIQYENQDPLNSKRLIQPHGNKYVVCNLPQAPLDTDELDDVYSLEYERTYLPMYEADGGVPAISEVKFSLTSSRGCFGGCNFCALTFHQGRRVSSRSHDSIIKEARILVNDKDFKGYIHDVGGPTANFRAPSCAAQLKRGVCKNKQCLFPSPCKNLDADHSDYIELLRKLRGIKGVKKVFIRSGVRFDYLLADKKYGQTFLEEMCKYHISGQLKVAPEHISSQALAAMGKPNANVYKEFVKRYTEFNRKIEKKQFLVPYLMSSHPGCTLNDAIELACYIKQSGHYPEQVQDFYPTPGTLSTCMFYTELDPRTMKAIYVPKTYEEKAMQRALIQYFRSENYDLVKKALIKAGRTDLIGSDSKCLIWPRKTRYNPNMRQSKNINNDNKNSSYKKLNYSQYKQRRNGTKSNNDSEKLKKDRSRIFKK